MKKKDKGYSTLAEHHAEMKANGTYDAMMELRRKQEEEREKRWAELDRAEAPVVEDLRAAGFHVQEVWQMVGKGPYPKAIPILFSHLSRPYPAAIREWIARALAVPETKALGWDLLLQAFRDEKEERVKDGMATAIAGAADDDVIEDVIALVQDTSQGSSRLLLLRALEKSKDPRARATLEERRTDPDLHEEIKIILKRLDRKMERKMARMMERKQTMH